MRGFVRLSEQIAFSFFQMSSSPDMNILPSESSFLLLLLPSFFLLFPPIFCHISFSAHSRDMPFADAAFSRHILQPAHACLPFLALPSVLPSP